MFSLSSTLLFYENIEAEICEILKIVENKED